MVDWNVIAVPENPAGGPAGACGVELAEDRRDAFNGRIAEVPTAIARAGPGPEKDRIDFDLAEAPARLDHHIGDLYALAASGPCVTEPGPVRAAFGDGQITVALCQVKNGLVGSVVCAAVGRSCGDRHDTKPPVAMRSGVCYHDHCECVLIPFPRP
jgi:hypothetical protein